MDQINENLFDAQILRLKAEEKLTENKNNTTVPVLEADVKKLLHELQVHQIELEMQNEELRQTNEVAEAALKKYTMLYDFAPMGYFTLDPDGIICELNFTAAELLGEKRFTLLNANFKLFVSEISMPTFNKFFKSVYSTMSKESCEITLAYNQVQLCKVYMDGVVTGEDHQCLLSVVDISDFKK